MSNSSPPVSSISISAPGKVILHGEHSVVYDKLAIAASLGLRTRLDFREIDAELNPNVVILDFQALNLLHRYNLQDIKDLLNKPLLTSKASSHYNFTHPELIDHDSFLDEVKFFIKEKSGSHPLEPEQQQALIAFFYLCWAIWGSVDVELKPFKITMTSELAVGAGAGSSASFAVTAVGFLLQYIKINKCKSKSFYKVVKVNTWNLNEFEKAELDLILKWSFQSEKIIHGTPSGVDNTICTYGGLVEFRKGTMPKLVEITNKFSMILINTNVTRDTKTLVKKVADLRDKFRMIVDGILELLDETTIDAFNCMKKINARMGDEFDVFDQYQRLGNLTDFNQNLLRSLGVSHPKLDEACQILSEAGLHGKLTGAGGGGFAICLVPPSIEKTNIVKIIEVLNSKEFVAVFTDLGGQGVSIDMD